MSASPLTLNEPDVSQAPTVPPSPEKIADTGLSTDAIRDLLLKVLYVQGLSLIHI